MANQPANPPAHIPAAAHVVGNAFVNQYYNVLHQSPQVVHRFYTDASRLTRAEAGADGAVDTVGTQREIYQKVMSSDISELKAEIKTVDSQDSHGGGVLVLVTGSLSTKSNEKRNFVQSFFLAPQEKGYFVLNDIFRYLDVETHQTQKPLYQPALPRVESDEPAYNPEPAVVHQPAPEPALEHHISVPEPEVVREITPALETEPPVEEVHDLSEVPPTEVEDEVGPSPVESMTTPVIEEPESPMVQSAPAAHVQEPEPAGEAPKKHSYASILKVYGTPIKPAPQPVVERPAASPSPSPSPAPAVAPAPIPVPVSSLPEEAQEKNAPVENEADGRSVYVKNLPMNCTVPELETAFSEFGPVKPGGVNVKNQKPGVCYAFVEFEEPAGAQSAIEASRVEIRGRQAYIEEKKTMGRGSRRINDSRGERPYRSERTEGGRGRGSYGGRSYGGRGMGPDSRERDGGSRGGRGGSGPSRGGYPNSNGTGEPAYSGGERRTEGQRAPRRNATAPQPARSNGPTAVAAV